MGKFTKVDEEDVQYFSVGIPLPLFWVKNFNLK